MEDPLISFGNAIRAAGLDLEGEPIMDGTRQRIAVVDGKRGNKNGSYIGFLDGRPAGSIENFAAGIKQKWKYEGGQAEPLTAEQKSIIDARRQQRADDLAAQHAVQALACERRWERATVMATGDTTPYLERKQVPAIGVRRDGKSMLVPMRDVDGKLWSIQTIFSEKRALKKDGAPIDKVMAKNARKESNFHLLGEIEPGAPILLAEGYATAASAHLATGHTVAVAFDSGNLDAVAGALRARHLDNPMLILGDDDRHKERNVGRDKATEAAHKHGAGVVFPQFAQEGPGTDFNDLHVTEGLPAVKQQIEQSLNAGIIKGNIMSKERDKTTEGTIKPPVEIPALANREPVAESAQAAAAAPKKARKIKAPKVDAAKTEVQPGAAAGTHAPIPAMPSSEEFAALQRIVATSTAMTDAKNDTVPMLDAKALAAADIKALKLIADQGMRDIALLAIQKSVQAQKEYQAAMVWGNSAAGSEASAADQQKPPEENAAPVDAKPDADASRTDSERQVKAFRSITGDVEFCMMGQSDGLEQEEAKVMVARHLTLLQKITNQELRSLAINNIGEAAHAQTNYDLELRKQLPTIVEEIRIAYEAARIAAHADAIASNDATRTQALDAAALQEVADARAKDREAFAKIMDWNTIERGDAVERKPAEAVAAAREQVPPVAHAPENPQASRPGPPDVTPTAIPPEVERAYIHIGNKFYHLKNKDRVAFEDHGLKLKTALNTATVALSMVQIAEARGWASIKVSGTPEFRKEAWREAALRGIAVDGYKPTDLDQADLARRMPVKAANNHITLAAAAPVSAAAPDAVAALAPAVASTVAPAVSPAAPSPSPARTRDILVSHGRAKYKHDPDPDAADSYFAVLASPEGKERTIWGLGLEDAIAKSGATIGGEITLIKNGEKQVEVDVKVKNETGAVVSVKKVGAVRNEWQVIAEEFATKTPAQAVAAHPELAGAVGMASAIDKRAAADGFTPEARAVIAARTKQNIVNSIELGNVPVVKLREEAEVKRQAQQELTK